MTDDGWNPESLRAQLNAYPPYAGGGVLVTHIAEDASEIRVEMPLTEQNLNLVGTHFGGSLYAMVDPHLMILLMQRLGPDYVVWDKEAHRGGRESGAGRERPAGRGSDEGLGGSRAATANGDKCRQQWTLEGLDEGDEVVATVLKTLYVRRKHTPH